MMMAMTMIIIIDADIVIYCCWSYWRQPAPIFQRRMQLDGTTCQNGPRRIHQPEPLWLTRKGGEKWNKTESRRRFSNHSRVSGQRGTKKCNDPIPGAICGRCPRSDFNTATRSKQISMQICRWTWNRRDTGQTFSHRHGNVHPTPSGNL